MGSTAASDSTLKQLTTCGVSKTCTLLCTLLLYINHTPPPTLFYSNNPHSTYNFRLERRFQLLVNDLGPVDTPEEGMCLDTIDQNVHRMIYPTENDDDDDDDDGNDVTQNDVDQTKKDDDDIMMMPMMTAPNATTMTMVMTILLWLWYKSLTDSLLSMVCNFNQMFKSSPK